MSALDPEMAALIESWKQAGQKIVFTNGVFDLLHPGHLAQLEAAKSYGDRLVVGLNSDSSVRQQGKGSDRPIMDQTARKRILEALRVVDAVVLFDDATPASLIAEILPDVLVKGADYAGRTVVGSEVVEGNGGKVVLVDLVPGYSTTSLLERVRHSK